MYSTKKIIVVLPAYNAASTLNNTYREIPMNWIDELILVDDCSTDETISVAQNLGIETIIQHDRNKGYGANQKTCYKKALEMGGDIIIMLHPDYQYPPSLIPAMASIIGEELYPVVLGSRILGKEALKGGMPIHKYYANRFLTIFQNFLLGENLTEYHTGFRAYSREVLTTINFEANSNDFLFDNQVLTQIIHEGYEIAEVTCPTIYFEESSSLGLKGSFEYGLGILGVTFRYIFHVSGLKEYKIYN